MEANKKRKSYTVAEKLAAITLAKRTSKKKAAREFKVDVKRIREWCKQEVALSAVTTSGNRLYDSIKLPPFFFLEYNKSPSLLNAPFY